MKRSKLIAAAVTASVALAVVVGSFALAGPLQDRQPAEQPQMQLPPGWTEADMQACIVAATPGKMHEHLVKGAGIWETKNTMWMYPGAEPIKSQGTVTLTPMMDGRYLKAEMTGEMPGMGQYSGFGIYGYDNIKETFVSTLVDNMSTGIANGTGALSSDGKTMTWEYTYMCPVTRKPVSLREIETITGPDTRTLEMFSIDPKSGKEFQTMSMELKRKPGSAQAKG